MQPDMSTAADIPVVEGFVVGRLIGVGGMGEVWQAVQLDTRRTVALKVISQDAIASPEAATRFRTEIEAASRLDHPAIARVFESRVYGGTFCYAMEFVDGVPIDEYVREKTLSADAVLELVAAVADGVQHAHLRGVMHRDLKPSNILVRPDGSPVIVDFGAAKFLEEPNVGDAALTRPGCDVGTLRYMSPEQAAGRSEEVDARCDVYALGVLLYELLAGESPYEASDCQTEYELRNAIVEGRRVSLRRRGVGAGRALEAVVDKSLRHGVEARYQSAGELSDDLRRVLRREPVHARQLKLRHLIQSWVVKRRKAVMVGMLVLIVAAAGVQLGWRWFHGQRADRRETAMVMSLQSAARLVDEGNSADARAQLETLPRWSQNWLSEHLLLQADSSARSLAGETIRGVELMADDRRVVVVEEGGLTRQWDAVTGRILSETLLPYDFRLCAVSPSGRYVAAVSNGRLDIIELATGQVVATRDGILGPVRKIAWRPDEEGLGMLTERGRFDLMDRHSLATVSELRLEHEVNSFAFGPGRGELTVAGDRVSTYEISKGTVRASTPPDAGRLVTICDGDGASRVLTGGHWGHVTLWDRHETSTDARRTYREAGSTVTACVLDPQTGMVFGGTQRGQIVVWRKADPRPAFVLNGHAGSVRYLRLSSDGKRLVSATKWAVKVWELDDTVAVEVRGAGTTLVVAGALSPKGDRFAVGYSDGRVELIDVATGLGPALPEFGEIASSLRFSHSGEKIALALTDGRVLVHDLRRGGTEEIQPAVTVQAEQLFFSHDDSLLAFTTGGRVDVYPASGGPAVLSCVGHALTWQLLDGRPRLLVSRSSPPDGHARLVAVDTATRQEVELAQLADARANGMVAGVGEEGEELLVIALSDNKLQVIEVRPDEAATRYITAPGPRVVALTVTRTGDLMFTAGDGVRARTLRSGLEVLTLSRKRRDVFINLDFSADNRLLGALGDNRYVVWRSR